MKFKAGTRRKAIEYENDLVTYWKEHQTFEKSISARPADNSYVFYDGPPFITGVPHHGTLLSSVIKDAVPRYWAMKGKRVERVWGWDSHGLPAENFVEKQLNITDRRDIGTKISLEDYIITARNSMVANSETWESYIDRIGRWVDFKGAYKTMDKNYMESIWWAFKTLFEKGKIYEGYKVLMYDTKFATPVSKNEVTMDNDAYQTVTDPSVYIKFKLADGRILLAWTTTPWTLPGNTAAAVNENMEYALVEYAGEQLIVANELVEKVFTDEKHAPLDYKILETFSGKELVGLKYEPLFASKDYHMAHTIFMHDSESVDYIVVAADYVSAESGTGIVHLAPAYGEEDFELAKQKKIRVVEALDANGIYFPEVPHYAGMEVWSSNKLIAKDLLERGVVWKVEYIQHEYPFNPRSKQRIMYRAVPSWFYDVEDQKEEMFARNSDDINWFPEHLKHGRFQKNIEAAPDWNLSRDRFWATAMPVWEGLDKHGKKQQIVVGSYAELKELSGVELEDYHRPWVDAIEFDKDGVHFKRIEKVLDGWFESGSMPFAQFHYPFENKEKFENNFPGDFIAEYVAQVRAWFYYLHIVNVGLFGRAAFKNVITTGTLAGNDGRKMSKSLGNYTDPNVLMDEYSADALRFLFLSSPLLNGEDYALKDKDVSDINRKLAMVWNMYDFFTLYASVDGWEFKGDLADPSADCQNPLDVWVISRVHQLITEVDVHMQAYDIPNAAKPILEFIEDASNWYVRRSRKRFWKSEDDDDKANAYRTLHYVLTQLAKVMAPFTPFLAEELYRNLTEEESVHLVDWPQAGHVDELLLDQMKEARQIIETGLGLRMQKSETEESIKVRQPLASLEYAGVKLREELEEIIKEEVNVKEVRNTPAVKSVNVIQAASKVVNTVASPIVKIDKHLTPALKKEGLMREIIRVVQSARKQADLQVDDRIKLMLVTEVTELKDAIHEHKDAIMAETLATGLVVTPQAYKHLQDAKIEGHMLSVGLEKA
jgi:isoleucyl-tRNA synthetase